MASNKKQRKLRKRKADDAGEERSADEGDETLRSLLQDAKLLHKARARPSGLSAEVLLSSAVVEDGVEELGATHGNSELLESYVKEKVKEVEALDPEMEKYVETQLAKRLGRSKDATENVPVDAQTREDQELYGVPENLKAPKHKVQDVSSWMTGIQEVPLPMAYKLRNIEDTEAAKKRLLASSSANASRAALEEEAEEEVDDGPKGPQRGTYPRDFGHQRTRQEAGKKTPPGIRPVPVSFKDRRRKA
ncbi:hypothetical protein WJX81_005270 [Elliptochloris bilobata]|uniref:Uncharacterized protein n=1 Tax=Elliptochloris bilobata TaxID=381761 RepID=A0AAW1S4Z4_9CHLO